MTESKRQIKLKDYTERNTRWTDKAISQLGYSINLFTTLGVSYLIYLVTNNEKFPKNDFNGEFSFLLTIYFISFILIFFSVCFGFISILSRLYDFRLTRHLTFIRMKYFKLNGNTKNISDNLIIDISKESRLKIFYRTVIRTTNLISQKELESELIKSRFEELRKNANVLGELTWKAHKNQIFCLLLASFFYGIIVFIN
ncbi:hypothetical protein [Polaribacter sp. R77954]|uniref:hypothetical protein n=1 Tax=Polaribacter sp. R77954 TaxID=3093870 RepID=UPI0037C8AA36